MKIKDFILNKPWDIELFNKIDISKYEENEQKLFISCKKLKEQNKEISAENLFKEGGKDMLLLYITVCNEIDKQKLQKEYSCKRKTKK